MSAGLRRPKRVNGEEAEGRQMHTDGKPCPPDDGSKGKKHAVWRGWMRAAAEARTKKRK
jgi:hypothetical protein